MIVYPTDFFIKKQPQISVAEIEKAIKSFENNKSSDNDGLPVEFYKTFNEILKTDLHKSYIKIPQLGMMLTSLRQADPVSTKKESERTELAFNLVSKLRQ